jgi:hypothetical protein
LIRESEQATPHPSRSGWGKRRSGTPSPQGRGLLNQIYPRCPAEDMGHDQPTQGEGCGFVPPLRHPPGPSFKRYGRTRLHDRWRNLRYLEETHLCPLGFGVPLPQPRFWFCPVVLRLALSDESRPCLAPPRGVEARTWGAVLRSPIRRKLPGRPWPDRATPARGSR